MDPVLSLVSTLFSITMLLVCIAALVGCFVIMTVACSVVHFAICGIIATLAMAGFWYFSRRVS